MSKQPQKPIQVFTPEFIEACRRFNEAVGQAVNNMAKFIDRAMEEEKRDRGA